MKTRESTARRLCVLAAAAWVLASGATETAQAVRPDGSGELVGTPSGSPEPKLQVSATARCAGSKAQMAVVVSSLETASAAQVRVTSPWETKEYPSLAPLKSASHVHTVGGAAVEPGRVTVTGLRPDGWITVMTTSYGALDCAS